jgi:small subunit ribosomal protein S17
MAHDEEGTCRAGDTVAIVECRPISKRKSWRVVEIVARAPVETSGQALP